MSSDQSEVAIALRGVTPTQRAVYRRLVGGGTISQHNTPTSAFGRFVAHPVGHPAFSVAARTVDALRNAGLIAGTDVSMLPSVTQARFLYWVSTEAKPDSLRTSK